MRLNRYKLATLVTAAGVFMVVETVPLLNETPQVMCTKPGCTVTVEHPHFRFSHVGSHGPGFESIQAGVIQIVTPAP